MLKMHRKVSFQNIIKNQIIAYIIELKQLLLRLEIEFIIKILFKLLNKDIINLSNLDFLVLLYYILYKFFIMKSGRIILIAMCIFHYASWRHPVASCTKWTPLCLVAELRNLCFITCILCGSVIYLNYRIVFGSFISFLSILNK